MTSKILLRAHYKKMRDALSEETAVQAGEAVVPLLKKSTVFKRSRHVACFVSVHSELKTNQILSLILASKKTCYLPKLGEGKTLIFAQYEKNSVLQKNRYGIPEPDDRAKKIKADELDLVIMPFYAFDRSGNRLGTGGGFYDNTFSFLLHTKKDKPYLLGLGYACQEAKDLTQDPWDVKLNGVLTEKEMIICSP